MTAKNYYRVHYTVSTQDHITVVAENEEEAQQKATFAAGQKHPGFEDFVITKPPAPQKTRSATQNK